MSEASQKEVQLTVELPKVRLLCQIMSCQVLEATLIGRTPALVSQTLSMPSRSALHSHPGLQYQLIM